jgi:hypothetical protein
MPYSVMTSAFHEAERLQEENPDRFEQIVSEATIAEPELANRDPLSLVTLYVYDQRVNT